MIIRKSTKNQLAGKLEGGSRVNDVHDKQSFLGNSLITIISATFNVKESIATTAESIWSQTYNNYEWIVIDGGSNDGTAEFLKGNEASIDYWLSEPDEGIYDAFNKGCSRAKGEWIIFLGAGDTLFDSHVLKTIALELAKINDITEIVYGKVAILGSDERIVEIANCCWKKLKNKWTDGRPTMPHHQGILHRKVLLSSDQPFDKKYSAAADGKLVLGSFMKRPPVFIDVVVSKAPLGGISSQPKLALKAAIEIIKVNREIGCFYLNLPAQMRFLCKSVVKTCIAMLVPDSFLKVLIDKYRLRTGRSQIWRK